MPIPRVLPLLLTGIVCLGAAGALLFGLTLYGAARLAHPVGDGGYAEIRAGNTRLDVGFEADFVDTPVITLTPMDSAPFEIAIDITSPLGFQAVMSDPLPRHTYFSWTAIGFEPYCADVPEPNFGHFKFELDDGSFARVTGWKAGRPTELTIAADDELTDQAKRALLRDVADRLAGSNGPYRNIALNRVLRTLSGAFGACPARPWRLNDADWSYRQDNGRGILTAPGLMTNGPEMSDVVEMLGSVIAGAAGFDIFQHNNQVVDFLDDMRTDIDIRDMTVVHFDTHSDFYTYGRPQDYVSGGDISEFINVLVARGDVAEIYWVLPDWTRQPGIRETFWDEEFYRSETGQPTYYLAGPKSLSMWVDVDRGDIIFDAPTTDADAYRRVLLHKVTLDELPDLSANRNVYVEVDADYFSNTGYDTDSAAGENPGRAELLTQLMRASDTLKARGTRPRLVSLSTSPSYTADEDRRLISYVFEQAAARAELKDRLIGYTHVFANGPDSGAVRVRRESRLHEFLFALRVIDHQQAFPDDELHVRKALLDNARQRELDQARTAAVRAGYSDPDALLNQLDRADGTLDGVVDLIAVDQQISSGMSISSVF